MGTPLQHRPSTPRLPLNERLDRVVSVVRFKNAASRLLVDCVVPIVLVVHLHLTPSTVSHCSLCGCQELAVAARFLRALQVQQAHVRQAVGSLLSLAQHLQIVHYT